MASQNKPAPTFLTSAWVTLEALKVLENNLSVASSINRQYNKVSDSGLAIRMVQEYDVNSDKAVQRFDVLYGVATLRSQFGVRVLDSYVDVAEPEALALDAPRMYGAERRIVQGFPAIVKERNTGTGQWVDAAVLALNPDAMLLRAAKRSYDYDPITNRYFVPGLAPAAPKPSSGRMYSFVGR